MASVNADARRIYPDLPPRVEIIDCTLRDGEQAPGVWFTAAEKIALATMLAEAGIEFLDAGFPASGNGDSEVMQEMRRIGIPVRLGATARPLPGDVAAAEAARADEVFLFMPTSERRLQQTLGVTRTEATSMFRAGAEDVVSRGMGLNLVFEDASRAEPQRLIGLADELRAHVPIRRLVLCDTVGCWHPAATSAFVAEFHRAFAPDTALCLHTHNDFGMAGANTLAGVGAGARSLTCTVNGLGERAGNADLAEVTASLTHILGVEHGIDPRRLVSLSETVERWSGIHTSATKPVTGFNVYRHESGVHVDAMLKDERSYEFLPAAWVGRRSEYVLGKHSGLAALRLGLAEAGIRASDEQAKRLLAALKGGMERRSKSAHEAFYASSRRLRNSALRGVSTQELLAAVSDAERAV